MKSWDIDKGSTAQGVQIDTEKRILRFNAKKYMVRIAGVNGAEIYIYNLRDP
jgi:hypothetical protein